MKQKELLFVWDCKQKQTRFFLDKMKAHLAKVDTLSLLAKQKGKVKSIDFKDVPFELESYFVTFYADAFFYSIASSFDILARYHTRNQDQIPKLYFPFWLKKTLGNNPSDSYLIFLKGEYDDWIAEIRDNRNSYAHQGHPLLRTKRFMELTFAKEQPLKLGYFIIKLENGREVGLVEYCEEIDTKFHSVIKEVVKNKDKIFSL